MRVVLAKQDSGKFFTAILAVTVRGIVLFVLVMLLCANNASAQGFYGGHIGLYSDNPGWSDCNLSEVVGAPNVVHVVHSETPVGNTVEFKIEDNWGAVHSGSDYGANVFIPTSSGTTIFDGGAVWYVGCKAIPHLVVTLTLIPFEPTPPCTAALEVVANPRLPSGLIEVVNCSGPTVLYATGGTLTVNGNSTDCACDVATEKTSWSRVKALYQ